MSEFNEASGSHPIPQPSEARLTIDIKHIVAFAAFLGVGGVGGGMISFSQGRSIPVEVTSAIAEVNAKLADMNTKLTVMSTKLETNDRDRSETDSQIRDHEQRLRALEKTR